MVVVIVMLIYGDGHGDHGVIWSWGFMVMTEGDGYGDCDSDGHGIVMVRVS